VDIRRGRVDAELHAQRPPERELAFELPLWENVNRMPRWSECFHGGRL